MKSGLLTLVIGVLPIWCLAGIGCSDKSGTGPPPGDIIPPATITDLRITAADYNKISLTWTAPGDDGAEGTAYFYDIRYHTELITDSNWSDAQWCSYVPDPDTAGTTQSYNVIGLVAGVEYYFAIRANDGDGNRSPASNNVSGQVASLFSAPVEYSAGRSPSWPAAADLDGDGDLDLAIAHSTNLEGNLTIMSNDGSGGFQQSAAYTAGSNPRWITSGDFDWDGDIDLAIADWNLRYIMIMHNQGNGTFSGPAYHDVGFTGRYITSADFNGDGAPDLAISREGIGWPISMPGALEVLLNDGTGASFTVETVGGSTRDFDIGDLDGDGDIDIAADYYTVNVFHNNGSGTSWGRLDTGVGTGNYSVSIVVAQLNEDSAPDIFMRPEYEQAAILLNNGSGGFVTQALSRVGERARHYVAGDFNGDGIDDLAGVSTENIVVSLSTGAGGFQGAAVYRIGYEIYAVSAADFNQDGAVDIVATRPTDGKIVVLLNYIG